MSASGLAALLVVVAMPSALALAVVMYVRDGRKDPKAKVRRGAKQAAREKVRLQAVEQVA